jgi:hypothetical protein
LGSNFAIALKIAGLKLGDFPEAEERPDIRLDAFLDYIGRRLPLSLEMAEGDEGVRALPPSLA